MQNWMLCFQTPYNSVKYITNELNSPAYLSYYKFLDYISTSIHILEYGKFRDQLDKFQTILINIDTHEWSIETVEKKKYSFDELFDYNEQKIEEEKNQKAAFDNIQKGKGFIEKITKNKNIGYKKDYIKKIEIPDDSKYSKKIRR